MIVLDSILNRLTFACCCAVVTVSPWLFASWEVWFFWPFVVLLFLGVFFLSLRLVVSAVSGVPCAEGQDLDVKRLSLGLLSVALFLAYAFSGLFRAEVFTDAERGFLLLLTPFLLGIVIVLGLTTGQRTLLYRSVLVNLFLLAVYGIVNHLVTGSEYVLWLPGYPQYVDEHRLTGTYFCPDHFAGLMEVGFCLALGILLARDTAWKRKAFAAVLALLALIIVVLSKSRGGGLTVLVIVGAVLVWGFPQWPRRARWAWRLSAVSLMALVLVIFGSVETGYMERFRQHFGGNQLQGKSLTEKSRIAVQALRASCRGQMYSAALRAWRTQPALGIGIGMHQNLWPHFAPSPDGNRELGVWPSSPNYSFFSYEVHNDWLQLLEEQGSVGLILFLVPVSVLFGFLLTGLRRETARWAHEDWRSRSSPQMALVLGGVLASVAMAFHSLGDFNLQMPATAWAMAAVVALPLAEILRPSRGGS